MKYICSWSGGKDSTASIILAHENNEPLDIILFSEVMFDKKNGVSGESPEHIEFIKNKAIPMFESWGYEVHILHAAKDYLDCFNHIIEKPRKYMEHKGMKYGFAISGQCSVKRDCKVKPINDYYKSVNEEITQYVGICIDEQERLKSLHKDHTKVSLLEIYNYTELMAKDLCEKYELLSPYYKLTKRGGCWFCPNAKLCEHEQVRNKRPDVWKKFISLEKESNLAQSKWNPLTKETLQYREEQLYWASKQVTIFDYLKTFPELN